MATTVPDMPFLSAPIEILPAQGQVRTQEPQGDLEAVIPLAKVQQILWIDYLKRPYGTHYNLTLRVELGAQCPTIQQLFQVIGHLTKQHAALRSTFHPPTGACDTLESYIAVHEAETSPPNIELIFDENRLEQAIHRGFNLFEEFPVRWVILQDTSLAAGVSKTSTSLFVVGHHIALDGTSMSLLSSAILGCCEKMTRDIPLEMDVDSKTWATFVQKQNAYLRSTKGDAGKSFWLSQIENCGPTKWLGKPASAPVGDYRKMYTWAHFSNEELESWSQLYKTSWFRIAVSIISLVTAGASSSNSHLDQSLMVAFGARPKGYDNCIGHFANTLPIKSPVTSILGNNIEFRQLVKQVGAAVSSGKKHELFPFLNLIEAHKEMNDTLPDFKVAVTFSPKTANSRCTIYPVEGVWDLFYCFLEKEDGVSLGVIADPLIFDTAAMFALQNWFMETVRLSQHANDFRVLDLSYLKARGNNEILKGPPALDVAKISSARVHHWIEARAFAQPQAIALYSAEKRAEVSYLQLNNTSNQFAHYLRMKGVRLGNAVVIYLDRGFATVIWILAILKAGGCYVVLDKTYPLNRKRSVLKAAETKFFVTDEMKQVGNLLDDCLGHVTIIETSIASWESQALPMTSLGENSTSSDDLAYMVFTSGSTGHPKGVIVEHGNLSHYVSACRDLVKIGPNSRVLQFASFSFDACVLEWAVTLTFGATLCFVDYPSLVVGEYLADVIEWNEINFFHLTPSVLSTIPYNRRLPSLQLISVGGEPSSASLLDKWRRKIPLLHAYGPTETTVIVTIEYIPRMNSPDAEMPAPSIIGRPLPNNSLLICSEDSDEPLQDGETGEICIIGPQVARGYKGQPDLTALKFRNIERQGQKVRLYRSGDRGFVHADGRLSICGRIASREVKLRGFRIDLAELEKEILRGNSELTMVSVHIEQDSMVAFVAPCNVDCAKVKERISQDVPAHSVPARIVALEKLPMNANGKIDHNQIALLSPLAVTPGKGALKVTSQQRMSRRKLDEVVGTPYPSKALKSAITKLWMEVLSLKSPIAEDITFFEAGGHSVLLTQLHRRIINEIAGAKVSLLDVFRNPTIVKQAALIGKALESSASVYTPPAWTPKSSPPLVASFDKTSVSGYSLNCPKGHMAIVGLAGLTPGADNIQEFWDILMEQREGISDRRTSPTDSKDVGEQFVPRYGLLNNIGAFDAKFWGLSESEACNLDPQKRLFLDVAYQALKDASIETSKDHFSNIGIFVGEAHNTYQHVTKPCHGSSFERRYRSLLDPNISTFTAYRLNLNGPNITINTACASSLVALNQGINAIRAKECDVALVGGVSVVFPQIGGYYTSEGGVFSASGRCRPLDASCDGSVPSDAVTAVVIKPLEAAIEAEDYIYSVIEGQAVGTDGSLDKVGFMVPSATGQAATVLKAMKNSHVRPEDIKYVEMHGSGTPIGDAMEVQGLASAFDSLRKEESTDLLPSPTTTIALGSNKGNFGNAEAASGLLSLIKASLAISKGILPPLQAWTAPNPLIDFEQLGFRPLTTHLELKAEDRIGVTALGLGGTNAHCVLASPEAYGVERPPARVLLTRENDASRRRQDRKILMAPVLHSE